MNWAASFRMLRYLRPGQLLARAWLRMRRPWFSSPLYRRLSLPDRRVHGWPVGVEWSWPGDAANGRRILEGRIRLLEIEAPFGPSPDWRAADQSQLWRFTLHYFEWLADLRAVGGDEARDRARALVSDWIRRHQRIAGDAWHPYPMSLRLYAWIAHAGFLAEGASEEFRCRFMNALDVQARHLNRVMELDVGGNHLVKNLKARIAAAMCLAGHTENLSPALERLERQLKRQILEDGCHFELSPSYHVQVLADLIDLVRLFASPPPWLSEKVAKMARAYAFFRHGDGGLALFNDGGTGDPAFLAAVDEFLAPVPLAPHSLKEAGYERLVAGNALAIFDAGRCCPDELPAHAHADALSFEFSEGLQRIVVNCGTYAYQDPLWRNRFRGTSFHSTVTIDDSDSAELFGVFRVGRRPRDVGVRREENRLEAWHDGYRHWGIRHRRLVSLAPGLLEGEDVVSNASGREIAARFHLHPAIHPESKEGAVLLHLPDGSRWRFAAEGAACSLAESWYAPQFHRREPSRQIRLTASARTPETRFSWRFAKE